MTTATQDITSRDGLLRAIIEEPFAIDLRHMLCDWLEEHETGGEGVTGRVRTMRASWMREQLANPESVERLVVDVLAHGFNQIKVLERGQRDHCSQPGQMTLHFRQGFAFKAFCYWADWDRLGARIVRQQPITEVVLVEWPTPFRSREADGVTWWDEGDRPKLHPAGMGELPPDLFENLTAAVHFGEASERRFRAYPDGTAARTDVSRACVNLARKRANLPALQWEPLTGETTGQQAEG